MFGDLMQQINGQKFYLEKNSFLGTLPAYSRIAPENKPSPKNSNLPTIIFQGLC